ncbi:MAG: KEOPS complex subunit Cgi121 [Thermoplasmata archaeon]
MVPLPSTENRKLWAVGARRIEAATTDANAMIRILRALALESDALVALFDARAIAGERHLLSAWAHLGRSREHGEPRLRDRAAEFALYVAGEDQLGRALAKVGVAADTERFVLVGERPLEPGPLLERFGLVFDADAYPVGPTEAVLERLGIGALDRVAVAPSAWEGLVLERVALVDLNASTASDSPAGRKPPPSSPPAKGPVRAPSTAAGPKAKH